MREVIEEALSPTRILSWPRVAQTRRVRAQSSLEVAAKLHPGQAHIHITGRAYITRGVEEARANSNLP